MIKEYDILPDGKCESCGTTDDVVMTEWDEELCTDCLFEQESEEDDEDKELIKLTITNKLKSNMTKQEVEQIIEEIQRVEDYTCSYWYPLYLIARANVTDTPATANIIWDIIQNRGKYVHKLRQDILLYTCVDIPTCTDTDNNI